MTTPIFLLPGLGARGEDLKADNSDLLAVHDLLTRYGKVNVLSHLPDINHTSSECMDLESVLDRLRINIMKKCAGVPPLIVGYSVGGFIAFEVCRRLEGCGHPVRLLIMLDASAVYIPAAKKSNQIQFARAFRTSMSGGLAGLPFLMAIKLGSLELARIWLLNFSRSIGFDKAKSMRLDLLVAYWLVMVKKFELSNYEGNVLLLKAEKGRPRITDPALGWAPYARNLEVVLVDGDHWSMLNSSSLLEKLDAAIGPLGLGKERGRAVRTR